jgi:hypothetical protein
VREHEQVVRGLIASSGITPDPDEVEQLRLKYPVYREMAERQYLIPEALEEPSDLILDLRARRTTSRATGASRSSIPPGEPNK